MSSALEKWREAKRQRERLEDLAALKAERERESAKKAAAWAAKNDPLDRLPVPPPLNELNASFGGLYGNARSRERDVDRILEEAGVKAKRRHSHW